MANPPEAMVPDLPPALADIHNKSASEILASLNSHPLFMTELEENDDLEAFKALAYEGTPLEVAQGFKERGNESFAEKGWKDAKEFYTKSINMLLLEVRKRQRGEETEAKTEDDVLQEVRTLELSLVNRAAANWMLGNYRSCTQDASHALQINGRNIKACYRMAQGLLALDKCEEAAKACERGLKIDPKNAALLVVNQNVEKRLTVVRERYLENARREQAKIEEERALKAALLQKRIKMRRTSKPPELEDARVQLVASADGQDAELAFPLVVLYPLTLQSDFIKQWSESNTFGALVRTVLPPPWDSKGLYGPKDVECYMETVKGTLIKVGSKITLGKALEGGSVEVVDEIVTVNVLPKAEAKTWIEEFKARKALNGLKV